MRKITFDRRYRPVFKFGVISVALLSVLPGLALDMGECMSIYIQALAVYLALLLIILLRRPSSPTKLDLLAIKWGFVVLFFLCLALMPFIWRLRGVD